MSYWLEDFVRESNRIEGILREPTSEEISITRHTRDLEKLSPSDVVKFVSVCQPNAVLRDNPNLNVRVGNHIAPRGGKEIVRWLESFCASLNAGEYTPHKAHCIYETWHPFTDGNGRSGRAIWLWQMKDAPLGFLHHFYYQTLQELKP